jgi:hypothetical protein
MLNERFVGLSADDPPKSSASRSAAEQARWNRAAVSGSRRTMVYPHACDYLRQSKQVESAIGDPQDARRSCIVLPDLHLAVGTIQKDRALPKQQHRGHPSCQPAKKYQALPSDCTDDATLIASPVLSALYACQFHHPDLDTLFSLKSPRFPYRKVRSMKGEETCKKRSIAGCNYLDQYVVDLLPGRRLAKDPAISLLPSIWS